MELTKEHYRLAAVAYNAYCKQTGGKSLATGDTLPTFDALRPAIKDAWAASAIALSLDADIAKRRQYSDVKYVAGFLFNDDGTSVALIHKNHGPDCMVGKWNAIGGKIEHGESNDSAMRREFWEEAGVEFSWTLFLRLKGPGWSVNFYHAFSSEALAAVRTCESERVSAFPLDSLPDTVSNLSWIIPMAISHENDHVLVYEVTEKEATE